MKAQRYSIHLQDEVPNLGSGLRVVVALVGHKWVRARNELAPQFTRVKRAVWDTLHPRLINDVEVAPDTTEADPETKLRAGNIQRALAWGSKAEGVQT